MRDETLSNADLPIVEQIAAVLALQGGPAHDPSAQGGTPAPATPAAAPKLQLVTNPPVDDQTPAGDPDPKQPVVDPNQKPDDGAQGDEPITNLNALAEVLGAEPEVVLESILVPNAIGVEVPLGEALAGWREAEETLETRRADLETTYQSRIESAQGETRQLNAVMTALARELITEMNAELQGVDLEALSHANPIEYVKLEKMAMRRRELVAKVFDAAKGFDSTVAKRNAEKMAQTQRDEAMKLARKRPDWVRKPEVIQTVVAENQALMRKLGYSDNEIASVTDHRHVLVLHYAAQHLKTLEGINAKAVPDAKKRQLLRPSGLRSGPRQGPAGVEVQVRQDRMKDFSQRRDVKSAAALIETYLPK